MPTSRSLALLATFLLLALLLWPFWKLGGLAPTPRAEAVQVRLSWVAPKREAAPAQASPVSAARPLERFNARPAVRVIPLVAVPELASPEPTHAAGALPVSPEPVASAPLQLDAATLRQAVHQSMSPMRRAAQAAGQDLPGDQRRSQQERLASDVAASSKPSCLAPGGSLLSAFTLAYSVAMDKCRF